MLNRRVDYLLRFEDAQNFIDTQSQSALNIYRFLLLFTTAIAIVSVRFTCSSEVVKVEYFIKTKLTRVYSNLICVNLRFVPLVGYLYFILKGYPS